MVAELGINVWRDGRTYPETIRYLGGPWVRFVLMPDQDLNPWVDLAHVLGLKVLGVIARESLGIAGPSIRWSYLRWLQSLVRKPTRMQQRVSVSVADLDFGPTVAMYADRYGTKLDAIAGGNESDHWSPSSWHLEPEQLNRLLAAICDRFPPPVGCGSMVSGDPGYMDAIDPGLYTFLPIHPYGRRPSDEEDWGELPGNFGPVTALLDRYRRFGKPLWITECGVPTNQVSPEFQARYCRALLTVLKNDPDTEVVTWFCITDDMVDGFGLFDADGRPKPAASAFMAVAGSMPQPDPQPDDDPCREDRERVARVRRLTQQQPYVKPSRRLLLEAIA